MKINIEFPRKLLEVYNDVCKPLCKELKLPQTAFDILMFLANNPQYQTARDIVKIRNIKANLVSINVDRLDAGRLSHKRGSQRRPKEDQTDLYKTGTASDQTRTEIAERFCRPDFCNTSREKQVLFKVMETRRKISIIF